MKAEKDDAIGRVKCIVNSCEHYQDGDHCTATHIEIHPRNASNSQETDCATFSAKF